MTTHPADPAAADPAAPGSEYPTHPVGPLQQVLSALADPVRLEMVRRLADLEAHPCAALYEGVGKSTASHHFKILREAGVTERSVIGGKSCQRLRLTEVEQRHPGLLPAVLGSAGSAGDAERSAADPVVAT